MSRIACALAVATMLVLSAHNPVLADPPAPPAAPTTFSPDDVSWLFPAPVKAQDFNNLIAVKDLTAPDPAAPSKVVSVWSVFPKFVEVVTGPAGQVEGTQDRITFPTEVQKIDAWFVAGVRIDPGAPGLSHDIVSQFGQSPQIRLIVQPVTKASDGSPIVHDIAVHLIFSFSSVSAPQPGCFPPAVPDQARLKSIVADVADLKRKLAGGQFGVAVATDGLALGVHPGLANASTNVALMKAMKAFLLRQLPAGQLNAMAIISVPDPAPKPWIFLSLLNSPAFGGVVPVHGPTLNGKQFAQELRAGNDSAPRVFPVPSPNNLSPMTCKSAALPPFVDNPPIKSRKGHVTAEIFAAPNMSAADTQQILNLVADPDRSHFFNTDCVSCHTETTLVKSRHLSIPMPIDPNVIADGSWDVRNFGWTATEGPTPSKASVTRRAANETIEVVKFINTSLNGKNK